MQAVNFKEIEILGLRVYEREDFRSAIDLAMRLPLEKIITREFPLEDVSGAFELFRAGEVCKVLILPVAAMNPFTVEGKVAQIILRNYQQNTWTHFPSLRKDAK